MLSKEDVIDQIRAAFGGNESPGDPYLQPYPAGYNLSDEIKAFKGIKRWEDASSSLLDENPDAISFFSETGFRLFLPAYLVADLNNELECVEPLYHLVGGFMDQFVRLPMGDKEIDKLIGKSALVNPIQYGAATWFDHFRFKLSIFPREEVQAIIVYLKYKRGEEHLLKDSVQEIDEALNQFWLERAKSAPLKLDLEKHIKAEQEYLEYSLNALRGNSSE